MKPCDDQCACGIARIDCDYHAPQPATRAPCHNAKYAFKHGDLGNGRFIWVPMHPWEAPKSGKFLTADGYIHTYQDGKLIDEEPA